jgi:hypothetical protein
MAGSKRSRSGARATRLREQPDEEIGTPPKGSASGGIEIDIPEVGPSTKIGELTVEQFVTLLDQVFAQLRGLGTRGDDKGRVRARNLFVKRLVDILQSDNGDVVQFRRLLGEAGKKVPLVLREIAEQMQKNNLQ